MTNEAFPYDSHMPKAIKIRFHTSFLVYDLFHHMLWFDLSWALKETLGRVGKEAEERIGSA